MEAEIRDEDEDDGNGGDVLRCSREWRLV